MRPTAEELTQRVKAGDSHALAELIEVSRSKLLVVLERKVGSALRSKVELEDILQEVSARAIKDFAAMEFGEQDPMGWLYQIMDRQIVDLHRFYFGAQKRNAEREISVDRPVGDAEGGFAQLLIASMTSPSAAFSRDMRLARVYEALAQLPDEMQQAMRWRYLENLPSQAIAERLGKTDVATRVLLSRALRKLKLALGNE